MNKLFFIYLTFQLLSFASNCQINMFDENGQKHGEWIENGTNFNYYHGKPTGKVLDSDGYTIYDSIGEIAQRVIYFQERPNVVMSDEYFQFGKTKLWKRFRINPSNNQVFLLTQESFKVTKKPNGYIDRYFDGLQVKYGGNIKKYPMGQRIEEMYIDGFKVKQTIYYPDGKNKLDEISFIPTGIVEYPYVQSLYTMYYKNGQKLIEFDSRYFFNQLIDKGSMNGNLKYDGNTFAELLNMVGIYCPEMKDYEKSNASNSFQSGYNSYKEVKNFFIEPSISIPIYSESGTVIKMLDYAKTNLVNDYHLGNYSLPSTSCKIDTVEYFHYALDGTYQNEYNRLEKYYLGMEDSIRVFPYGETTIYLLFEKGKLHQIEKYRGNTVEQASYNEQGIIHGSHKVYDLRNNTVEEVIYNNGKKISAPPIRTEIFIPKLKR